MLAPKAKAGDPRGTVGGRAGNKRVVERQKGRVQRTLLLQTMKKLALACYRGSLGNVAGARGTVAAEQQERCSQQTRAKQHQG